MNRKLIFSSLITLIFITQALSKILIVIGEINYNGVITKVNEYANHVRAIESKTVEIYTFQNPIPNGPLLDQCTELWLEIVSRYNTPPGDPIEGAVFIGDLPLPLAIHPGSPYRSDYIHPVDAFYMDLGYIDPGTGDFIAYGHPNQVWDGITLNSELYINRDIYKRPNAGLGDGRLEIWVSRIYGKTLKHLRGKDAVSGVWGNFLEENQIINEYLDRVIERMTQRAKVPPRGFTMGYPDHFSNGSEYYLQFQNLKLESLISFEWNITNPFASTPSKWQSQLQAGPYGNVNKGAFMGVQHNDPKTVKNNINDKYVLGRMIDTRGYDWAGIFEHSTPNLHTFNYTGNIHRNGEFSSMTIGPVWEKVTSGGSDGNGYYRCKREDELMDEAVGYYDISEYNRMAEWVYVVKAPGDYNIYMYYEDETLSEPHEDASYYNIRQNATHLIGGWVNQKTHTNHVGNWELLTRNGPVHLNRLDEINIGIAAGHHDQDPQNSTDYIIADAIMLRTVPPTTDIIIHIENSPAEQKEFFSSGMRDRSFISMRDDEGPSKAHFFLEAACQIAAYSYPDNLGLLYAMGHNGLIMMGNAYWNGSSFGDYTESLGNGESFGEAFLKMSDRGFIYASQAFILMGAGTLKPDAYYKYIDSNDPILRVESSNDGKDQIYFAKETALVDNGSLFSISNGSKTKIVAGNTIQISDEFHAEYGSNMHLKIVPEMTIDP